MRTYLGHKALFDNKISYIPRTVRAPTEAHKMSTGFRVDQSISSQKVTEGCVHEGREMWRRVNIILEASGVHLQILSLWKMEDN